MKNKPAASTADLTVVFRLLAVGLIFTAGLGLLAAVDFDVQRLLELSKATRPAPFVLLMSLLPLGGFPIAAFYLFAGSVFPWWQAWLLCCLSLAINIAAAYPIGLYLLRQPVARVLARYRTALPELTPRNQFRVTFLARSIPGIPYPVQNYMLALMGVPFPVYFIVSWSVQSVFAAGMAAVPKLAERAGLVPVLIIGGLLLVLVVLYRHYGRTPQPPAAQFVKTNCLTKKNLLK